MKKRKLKITILNKNTPSTPSQEALNKASMTFTLDVHSTGTGQTGGL